ncbi:TonB-dependent receptor [Veillonella sp.]|uniref:TonB-dependent receptor n=1 Tax=Veillonella sp. TaxID=1926307 RepID=UPI0025F50D31|nr:TonB-dependent receptor [Veillonella sp.]
MDGWRVSAQPKWSGVLGVNYEPNESTTVLGRMTYFGDSIIRNSGQYAVNVPSYTVFDVGVQHKLTIGDIPTTLSFMAYNVFDKKYWMAARGNQVYVSMPRTYMLSAQFDF